MIKTPVKALVTLALVLGIASPATAQEGQWRVTTFLTSGGFASDLLDENFTINVEFPDINLGDQEADIVFDQGYEFDTFTGVGASLSWRKNHVAIEGALSWIPTRAVAITETGEVPDQIANAFGFEVDPSDPTEEVPSRLKTSQNLLIPTVGISYFFSQWEPGRPPPAWEFYLTGSLGIVSYLDDEPIQTELQNGDWDTPVMFSFGVGTQLNFTPGFAVRVDLRDQIWSTDIMGQSKTQHAITFAPAVSFVL